MCQNVIYSNVLIKYYNDDAMIDIHNMFAIRKIQ